jgi:hypothetical protein
VIQLIIYLSQTLFFPLKAGHFNPNGLNLTLSRC